VPVPGVRIHGGDHPILGHPPRDPEHPLGAGLQVLAQHRGQQRRRLPHRVGELATIQHREHREPVPGPGVDQLLAGRPVIPVDLRLTSRDIAIPARQHRPQLSSQRRVGGAEQPPQRRADQRDRVHGGHRVIQRGRVPHPPPPHQPRRTRRLQPDLKDPVRTLGIAQPRAHIHQHRMREPRPPRAVPADPRRVAPPHIKGVPLDRLPIREPIQTLQHHHRGHHKVGIRTVSILSADREEPVPRQDFLLVPITTRPGSPAIPRGSGGVYVAVHLPDDPSALLQLPEPGQFLNRAGDAR
jgi:hypothetical protein